MIKRLIFKAIEAVLPNVQVQNIPVIGNEIAMPQLYNEKGERIKLCYLYSPGSEHHPYGITDGRVPKRILWDRFNFKLDTHFYSSEEIFSKSRGGEKKYALLLEGKAIIPKVYEKIHSNPQYIENRFDALFTHSKVLLNVVGNARFCPAYGVWYGTTKWGGVIGAHTVKTEMISFVGCEKTMAKMHLFRQEVTRHFLESDKVDVMGKAVGRSASCDEIFTPYRYNIALENDRYDYYFTEKIMNCFAAKTIPIYYGCPSIEKFFNLDGIIFIEEPTIEAIEEAVGLCSVQDYENRKEAVEDNFERVQKYLCVEDYLCDKYPEILK